MSCGAGLAVVGRRSVCCWAAGQMSAQFADSPVAVVVGEPRGRRRRRSWSCGTAGCVMPEARQAATTAGVEFGGQGLAAVVVVARRRAGRRLARAGRRRSLACGSSR